MLTRLPAAHAALAALGQHWAQAAMALDELAAKARFAARAGDEVFLPWALRASDLPPQPWWRMHPTKPAIRQQRAALRRRRAVKRLCK